MAPPQLEKPCLALTLSVAGKRHVPEAARDGLSETLDLIFREMAGRLAILHRQIEAGQSLALRFSPDRPARLSLVTGLADGADQIASDLFLSSAARFPGVERVLGAILPCDRATYVANSPVEDEATFARQADACAFVMELDGALPRIVDDDPEAQTRRAAHARGSAFAAQSEILLRQCDVLVAVDDHVAPSQIGGTRQTVRDALEFGVPVILLRLGDPEIAILRTRSDLDEPVRYQGDAARDQLAALVADLIGPDGLEMDEAYVSGLLKEFYGTVDPGRGPLRLGAVLSGVWSGFERRFRRAAEPAAPSPTPMEPYRAYRTRASALSSYYSSLHRGAFLAGYALAIAAVAFAVLSLLTLLAAGEELLSEAAASWILLGLGLLKLLAVTGMTVLARHAHGERISHRAADYRYLSERLRAMAFLPLAGSLRPPSHVSQPYATRVATQGVIDRLFYSIARQALPLETLPNVTGATIRPRADTAAPVVGEGWIRAQRIYHQTNAAVLARMTHWLERAGRQLNALIVLIVLVDLALVGLGLAHLLPKPVEALVHGLAEPVFVALAAILPAVVASMNGVRFQSEFSRLADRSEQMKFELMHLEHRAATLWARSDRLLDVLRVAEDAARLTLDEVAEWTTIYGKEFVEM